MPFELNFQCLPFEELSNSQLYDLLQLRSEIFVVEQDCVYQDMDGLDKQAYHLLGYKASGQLVAYTRLLSAGLAYPEHASIGRVLIKQIARGTGLGKVLMERSIIWIDRLYDTPPLKISAQYYLLKFYQDLGFYSVGDQYLEDGIPHIAMILSRKA